MSTPTPLVGPVPFSDAEQAALHDEMLGGLVDAVADAELQQACPAWCTLPAGHPFPEPEFEGDDDRSRFHEHSIGSLVTVSQLEHQDGTYSGLVIETWTSGFLDATEADSLALQLTDAAQLVRSLKPRGICLDRVRDTTAEVIVGRGVQRVTLRRCSLGTLVVQPSEAIVSDHPLPDLAAAYLAGGWRVESVTAPQVASRQTGAPWVQLSELVQFVADDNGVGETSARGAVVTYLGQVNELDHTAWDNQTGIPAAVVEQVREASRAWFTGEGAQL